MTTTAVAPPFQSLDDVLSQVAELRESGYEQMGNWSLGQMCNHLAQAIDLTVKSPFRWMPRLLQRMFVGTFLALTPLGRIGGKLGLRVPTSLPQRQPVDDEAGVERLAESAKLLADPAAAHLLAFHLWHCRHHLAFLAPNAKS